jgi:hypothetical protein
VPDGALSRTVVGSGMGAGEGVGEAEGVGAGVLGDGVPVAVAVGDDAAGGAEHAATSKTMKRSDARIPSSLSCDGTPLASDLLA